MIKEIESIDEYFLDIIPIPIGIGTTAICYEIPENKILKLYRNTYGKRMLFSNKDIIQHLKNISKLQNNTYIAPEEILVKGNECIGYIYNSIKGPTLYNINKKTKINDILFNYDNIVNDTKDISESYFHLGDLHDKNIIYSDGIKIIDLDRGYFYPHSSTFLYNMLKINGVILDSLFNALDNQILIFTDDYVNYLYNESMYKDYKKILLLFDYLQDKGIITKSDARQYKRKKTYCEINDYYKK